MKLFLASFGGTKGIAETQGKVDEEGKPLEKQKLGMSLRLTKARWRSASAILSRSEL
jgi:hypothetical protein